MREVRREAAMRIILISRTVVVSAPTLLLPLSAASGNWLCRLPRMPQSLDFFFLCFYLSIYLFITKLSLQGVSRTCGETRSVAVCFSPRQEPVAR